MRRRSIRHASRRPIPSRSRSHSSFLLEAWSEARLEGVDGDCLAQASLFSALSELVTTYGEDATAKFAEGLAARIRNGEFSLRIARQ